jgi:protein-L-isoaspartate O-methyltransferase
MPTEAHIIKTPRVRDAMLATDRGYYAVTRPYDDTPQPIGKCYCGRIHSMHMSARTLQSSADVCHSHCSARSLRFCCSVLRRRHNHD